jgi:hypothetical protein
VCCSYFVSLVVAGHFPSPFCVWDLSRPTPTPIDGLSDEEEEEQGGQRECVS